MLIPEIGKLMLYIKVYLNDRETPFNTSCHEICISEATPSALRIPPRAPKRPSNVNV